MNLIRFISISFVLFMGSLTTLMGGDTYEKDTKNAVTCFVRVCPTLTEGGCVGSGFFVADNKILTAYHVIDDCVNGNHEVRIEYRNKIYPCKIVETYKEHDLALLEALVENEEIAEISLDIPEKGSKLYAHGHPKGIWKKYISVGEAIETVDVVLHDAETDKKYDHKHKNSQHTVKIIAIPGMSGGPLFYKGKVIGLLRSKHKQQPLGYFASSKDIMNFLGKIQY